jgi:hypothetical protein
MYIHILYSECVLCLFSQMSQNKRKHLKLHEKAEILESLHGAAPIQLSRKYGVSKSTITSIKNKRQKILKYIDCTLRIFRETPAKVT